MKKDIRFFVKKFWPYHSKPNGFSIKNIALKYRLKIPSLSANEITKKPLDNNNLILMKKDTNTNNDDLVNLTIKRTHWANRDFCEYKRAS